MKKSNYHCGIDNEKKVAKKYKKGGAKNVSISPGSRGSYDVHAKFNTRKDHLVQVKSTCETNGKPKNLSKKELSRLLKDAEKLGAIPVIATVDSKGTSKVIYARNGLDVKL